MNKLLEDKNVDPHFSLIISNNTICLDNIEIVNRLLEDIQIESSRRPFYPINLSSQNSHISVVDRLLKDERVDPSVYNNYASI